MFRNISGVSRRLSALEPRTRSFASAVLLHRAWQTETVATLKAEAKKRGLSMQGNKSTLVARIEEHEQQQRSTAPPPVPGNRNVSTQTVSPGVPPASQPPSAFSTPPITVKLPDLSQPDPEIPVQIPFVPDFWDSAPPKAQSPEPTPPKILVVAGSITQPGGWSTYDLNNELELTNTPAVKSESTIAYPSRDGFWRGLADDLGLPPKVKLGVPTSESIAPSEGGVAPVSPKNHSRPLDKEEVKGAWLLLGLLTSAWVVGGILKPKKTADHEGGDIIKESESH